MSVPITISLRIRAIDFAPVGRQMRKDRDKIALHDLSITERILDEMVMGTLILAIDTPLEMRQTLLGTLKILLTSVLRDLQQKD